MQKNTFEFLMNSLLTMQEKYKDIELSENQVQNIKTSLDMTSNLATKSPISSSPDKRDALLNEIKETKTLLGL